MAYVYRHIRLDKNEPFYIGIGGDDNYKRSETKQGRNEYWNNIVRRTDYSVDIIVDDVSWQEACVKEQEFISIYKRTKDGGTLCNLTLGGEGQKGMIPWNFGKETTEETKQKQSLKRMGVPSPIKGTKRPPHVIEAVRKACIGNRWCVGRIVSEETKQKWRKSMEGKHRSGNAHHNYKKPMPDHVKEALRRANDGREPPNKGKKMPTEQLIRHRAIIEKLKKAVYKYDLSGNFIEQFNSLTEAAKSVGITKGGFQGVVDRDLPYKGYFWKYKSPNE